MSIDSDSNVNSQENVQARYIQPPAPVYVPTTEKSDKPKRSLIGGFVKLVFKMFIFGFYAFGILLLFGVVVLLSGGMINTQVVQSGDKQNQLAIIDLNSEIDMECASRFATMLNTAADDDSIKGVIVSVNSPGGMVVPADMMAHAVDMFKAKTTKPIYVSVEQLSASGAYWATAGCDRIFAQTNSMVGSIGVIYTGFVVKDGLEKIGVTPVVVKSSRSNLKDMGSMFRMPTDEELADIQRDIDTVHDRFIDLVAKGRSLSRESVLIYATGDVYDGPESLKAGLIDQIGFLDEVIDDLANKLNIGNPHVIKLSPIPSFMEMLTSASSLLDDKFDVRRQYIDLATMPKIQAIWMGN